MDYDFKELNIDDYLKPKEIKEIARAYAYIENEERKLDAIIPELNKSLKEAFESDLISPGSKLGQRYMIAKMNLDQALMHVQYYYGGLFEKIRSKISTPSKMSLKKYGSKYEIHLFPSNLPKNVFTQ